MEPIDFNAAKKWAKLPKDVQKYVLNNVFCPNCGVTTIVRYSLLDDDKGIIIKGKCIVCGDDIARFVEDD